MSSLRSRLLVVAGALSVWAGLTETGLLQHRAIAGPLDTGRALRVGLEDGSLIADLLATTQRLGLGVALGLGVGLPLGLWVGTGARRHRLMEPGMDFMRAIPPLLIFPLLLLAFGYGDTARVAVIAYATSLVISLHVSAGARRVPKGRVEALRAMGATRWQMLRWVHVYETLPSCLTALRHAVSTGLVVAVVTEMLVGAAEGLGSRAVNAQIAYDAPALYAVILATGATGYALGSALMAVERRIVFWEALPADGGPNEDRLMQFKLPKTTRRWIAVATAAVALLLAIGLSAELGATRPTVPEPIEQRDRVVDRVRGLFPQTKGWFRIVATARFDTGSSGRIVPDYSALTHERVRWEDAAGHTIAAQFAPAFRNATRILSGEDPDTWIDVIPEGGNNVEAQIQDGLVVYPDAYRDTDVLYKSTPTHTDEYLLLRTRDAPTRWVYRVRLGPNIAHLRQGGTAVEGVDRRGVPWMRGNAPFAVDQTGRRVTGVIRVDGDRIIAEIDTSELELPILVDPDWRSTGDMSYGRFYFGAHVLPDGRVLATGGCSASTCSGDLSLPACRALVNTAEALDLDTRTWSRAGDGVVRAFFHVSHSLPDGDVLVAGGCATSDCAGTTGLAEVYDTEMAAFRSVDPFPEPNAGMISATLPDGRVLVAGGCDQTVCSDSAYAFDPSDGTWTSLGDMNTARGRAGVTVLHDGRVMVVGGCTDILCSGVLDSVEIYDPTGDIWDNTGGLSTPRGGHYVTTLLDGRVLVGGGCATQGCSAVLSSAEIWDSATEEFTATAPQRQARVGAMAVRLPDGSVMINQGCSTTSTCDLSNELFDPATGEFSLIEEAVTVRAFHETILHGPRQQVVAVGGCQPSTCSWWNETYDVSHLMAPPDAGPTGDAGPTRDAATSLDAGSAGMDAGTEPPTDGGCGCRAAGTGGASPAWWAFGLAALLRLRRRAL